MRIQVSLDAVSEIVDTSVMGQRRRLAIGIATTIAPAVMAGFWRHVLTQLPMVELQFFPMRPGEAEAEVLSGRYDLCLLTDPPKPNMKLTVLPLFRECLRLAMAADHSFTRKAEITPRRNVRGTLLGQAALRIPVCADQAFYGSQHRHAPARSF